MGVDIFFSLMRSYFCLLVAALRPCQGREPRLKYMRTYPRDSKSSRLDCSVQEERQKGENETANRRFESEKTKAGGEERQKGEKETKEEKERRL